MKLRPFQRQFIKGALGKGISTAALSLPRGNGKSRLAAFLLERCLTPGDKLHVAGAEYLLCAASLEQARICFRFLRAVLEPTGHYRFLDASTRLGITDTRTQTRLRVLSSNAKTSMGIVGCPMLVADEPGSWETVGGSLMFDSISTAMGKPNSPLRAVFIGTLAPAKSGWWHDLIEGGTVGSIYVQSLRGDPEKWDSWPEIRRCNPLSSYRELREKLLEERDQARRDSRLKARFLSYRLNLPSADESAELLTVGDWRRVTARPVPEAEGAPIVACDMGMGRSWSSAVAIYRNGRTEALALAPGIPDLEAQELRDRVPSGTYRKLAETGALRVSVGQHVPLAAELWSAVVEAWGYPELIVLDRFRVAEMMDSAGQVVPLIPRVTRWSTAGEDIRALRRLAMDGPLCCAPASIPVIAASLSVSRVKNDDQGNTRLTKQSSNNTGRDDVAAALVLAAGEFARQASAPVPELVAMGIEL